MREYLDSQDVIFLRRPVLGNTDVYIFPSLSQSDFSLFYQMIGSTMTGSYAIIINSSCSNFCRDTTAASMQPIQQTDTTNLVPPAEPTTLVPSSVLHATSQALIFEISDPPSPGLPESLGCGCRQ